MSGGSTKKLIATALLTCFLASHSSYTFANTLHGSIQKENQQIEQENIFTGEIHTVEEKEVINMTVSQVLSGAYSQEGDEFFAEITQEVRGKRGVVLPVGTIAHGTIRQIEDAKRMGRDAWVEMDFDFPVVEQKVPRPGLVRREHDKELGGFAFAAAATSLTLTVLTLLYLSLSLFVKRFDRIKILKGKQI